MKQPYFSEREAGPKPRIREEIPQNVWAGLSQAIRRRIDTEAFGAGYPEMCPDGFGPCGCNTKAIEQAIAAEHPEVAWPPSAREIPPKLAILDLLEFCHAQVGDPIETGTHDYFMHYHYDFDKEAGQEKFRDEVNRIFARNGIAYHLDESGAIIRLGPDALHGDLSKARFNTGDDKLDELLETARRKFLDAEPRIRREGMEKLWDAFERLKTLEDGKDKKAQVEALLGKAIPNTNLRNRVDAEMRELTDIGNSFHIRHTETTQTDIQRPEDIDFLFHRLYSVVSLLLRSTGRI